MLRYRFANDPISSQMGIHFDLCHTYTAGKKNMPEAELHTITLAHLLNNNVVLLLAVSSLQPVPPLLPKLTCSSLTLSNRLCPSLARYHFSSVALVSALVASFVFVRELRQCSDEMMWASIFSLKFKTGHLLLKWNTLHTGLSLAEAFLLPGFIN